MKKFILITAIAFVSASSFAQLLPPATGSATSTSGSNAAATNAGNTLTIEAAQPLPVTTVKQEIDYGTQTIRNTPSVSGPNLTTSNDTCMGSSSGSLNTPGIGISVGSTWVDKNCKMLKNSRELWNMGMKAASMALMCSDAENAKALKLTGYVCPQEAAETAAKVAAVTPRTLPDGSSYTGSDPIVLSRHGVEVAAK